MECLNVEDSLRDNLLEARAENARLREALTVLLAETMGDRTTGTWDDAVDMARSALAGKEPDA